MEIHQFEDHGALVVVPVGRLDSTTSPKFDQHLAALAASGERGLVIDFGDVEYISSAGLRVLLLLARHMRDQKGRLALCALGDRVRQVFELAGFVPLFQIRESRADAVREVARA